MNKRTVRLTESQLKKVISESVKRVLNEKYTTEDGIEVYEWFDECESEYFVIGMIKSDMNPLKATFKATNIDDAISQARKYFTRFTSRGEKDVDIFYVKGDTYDGI